MAEFAGKAADVLSAALSLFVEKTYHGTAMPEIAAHAKVGMGTVYRYFPNKERLVNDLYRQLRVAFNTAVLRPVDEASVQQSFYVYWERIVSQILGNLNGMQFLELHPHESYLDADNTRLERQFGTALEIFVAEGQRIGAIKVGAPEMLASIIHGTVSELVRKRARPGEALSETLLDEAKYSLWAAIKV